MLYEYLPRTTRMNYDDQSFSVRLQPGHCGLTFRALLSHCYFPPPLAAAFSAGHHHTDTCEIGLNFSVSSFLHGEFLDIRLGQIRGFQLSRFSFLITLEVGSPRLGFCQIRHSSSVVELKHDTLNPQTGGERIFAFPHGVG